MSFKLVMGGLTGYSFGGLAGPASFNDPAGYWGQCTRISHCHSGNFLQKWPNSYVANVGCDRKEGYCRCRKGFMDADNEPSNGCETRVHEKQCRFGSCKDHGAKEGEECANWGNRLVCSGSEYSCCLKTEEYVEGTSTATTESMTTTTTNADYNADSFDSLKSKMTAPYDTKWSFAAKIHVFTYKEDVTYNEECSGAIIHDQWVLTAGHCCSHSEIAKVYLGFEEDSFAMEMTIPWDNMFVHVLSDTDHYDYCMLKLPVSVTHQAQRECSDASCVSILKPASAPYTHGNSCFVGAWKNEVTFEQTGVNLFSRAYCHWTSHYDGLHGPEFCAGLPDLDDNGWMDAESPCIRTHGAPLVCPAGAGYVLRGISSWGECRGQGRPGVYMDVHVANEWIYSMIAQYTDEDHNHSESTTSEYSHHTHRPYYYGHTHGEDYDGYIYYFSDNAKPPYI